MRFEGRTIVVTGAARGIGRAIVRAFAAEGARVFATDVLAERLETVRAESPPGRVVLHVADLANVDEVGGIVPAALRAFGAIDVLVNDAAVEPEGPALEVRAEAFDACFAVNVRAPMLLMRDACRHWVERGSPGAIVNVASANALQNESPESFYNASKAALLALTRAFAHELGHHGIRVNAVAPGETMTPEEIEELGPREMRQKHRYLARIPLRRAGAAYEPAKAVLFLASDDAAFITAQTLVVDGGETGGGRWYDEDEAPPLPPKEGGWYRR